MQAAWIETHRAATQETFAVFRRTPREALRFVTIIVHAVVVGSGDEVDDAIRVAVENHAVEHRAALMRRGRIARGVHSVRTRWAYVYEIDLLHPRFVTSAMKTELLARFGIDMATLNLRQRVLLLHTHGLVDCRGHASVEILAEDLRRAFPGPRRVHLSGLNEEGSVAENVERIAGYCTKLVHRYSRAWGNQRTEYHCNYEPEWRDIVMRGYESIALTGILNANITTQAKIKNCRSERYSCVVNSAAESIDEKELQLMMEAHESESIIKKPYETNSTRHNDERDCQEIHRGMRYKEIVSDYVDTSKIDDDAYRHVLRDLDRQGPLMDPVTMQLMYGDTERDLDLERKHLEIMKLHAEISKLQADTRRIRMVSNESQHELWIGDRMVCAASRD